MTTTTASEAAPAGLSAHAFSSVFQAVTGLRNRRAIIAMLGCTFVGVIVAGLLLAMTGTLGFLAGLLAMIVWVVAIGTGVNAAGLLQMDHARGISPRSIADALVYGLMCIPKLIVLGLAFLAVEIAVFIVLALLLFICKIPFLGPILFVVVFPLSVVVAGITIVGLFICLVLSLPAIWQGASITRALAQTFAIVKSRLVEAVLLLVFVGFLCLAVGMIIFGVLGFGLVPTLGMSVSIVGFGGFGMESIMAMSQGGGGGGGHAIAGAIGGALLWAVAASLVGQVYLLGLSLVYLRVTEGLDLTATEAALRATFDDARRRTAELGERARQATHRDGDGTGAAAAAASVTGAALAPGVAAASSPDYSRPPAYSPPPNFTAPATPTAPAPGAASAGDEATIAAPRPGASTRDTDIALPFDEAAAPAPAAAAPWTPPQAAPLPPPAPLPATTTCPQCLSPVTPEDAFCGVCGYRLK
ncbi:MAG: zinc ribbon domain-containing protein [Caldimonas sp.]